ncbi:MAG: DNA polymerase/3'-5' exonuclease PolX [Patescibacteria group bacterium]|nr:DNA polymerase/3'-5' exonuclease PolX [Patescibacteria group bacterium]
MDNQKVAEIFQEIGDLLDIANENPFRIKSYHKAAQVIGHMPKDIREIYEKNPKDLENIPGIGKGLRELIEEIFKTGKCSELDNLKKGFPPGILEMLKLRGVGPKKVKLFYQELGLDDLNYLKKTAVEGRLRDLPGMGEKSEQDIINAIDDYQKNPPGRMLINQALANAQHIIAYMKDCKDVQKIEYVGSLRRMKETIGDLDILTTGKNAEKIIDHFTHYPGVKRVIAKGDTKSSVILDSGVQVDLRVLEPKSFGAAMHYFTGSKAHNIHIRALAKRKGLKISEYGVFKGSKMIGGKTEEEVFKSVGLPYIPPELREDNGEFEEPLPKLIETRDLKGDLHMHTKWSDGSQTILDIAKAYKENGYEYIAIADHSGALGITGGLKESNIDKYLKDIEKADKKMKDFKILKGCEVDVMKGGDLYFGDNILKKFDIAIASIHTAMSMDTDSVTKRLIKAIENPYVNMLGHPTGRLLNQRTGYEPDMEKIIKACAANNVVIEINANPMRLDLYDIYCKMAKSHGVKIAINTDAHHSNQMQFLTLGVAVARRGWLEKSDVITTYPLKKLLKALNR